MVGLFCSAMCVVSFAQVDTGVIAGSVHDSQGAGVASASIAFVEIDTNVTAKTRSDETGDYTSPPLRPGNYRVVAGASGFKTQTRSTITLKVQDRLRMDFDMTVGAMSETVEVRAETPTSRRSWSEYGEHRVDIGEIGEHVMSAGGGEICC